jgi:predicted enzyme related to lactoylglutathione lyase
MALITEPLMEVILFVQDMEREVWFYRDVLGLTIRYPQGLSDYSREMWVEFATGDCTLALHGGAQHQPQTLHEIVFLVSDVAEVRRVIIQAGIKIGEVRTLEDGAPIAEGVDPAGHRFAIRAMP